MAGDGAAYNSGRIAVKISPYLYLGLRLMLGVVFLWAGVAKVADLAGFVQVAKAYRIVPLSLVVPIAVTLPWLEVLTGAGLVLGLWTRTTALLAALQLTVFAVVLSISIARDMPISCGCFGLGGDSLEIALVRDLALLLVAGVTVLRGLHAPFAVGSRWRLLT